MLEADLHVHSLSSNCGLHSILELLAHADIIGLKALAITDHGPAIGGRVTSVFFERFRSPFPDVTLYKGIELNVIDDSGTIDLPRRFMEHIDLMLLGIHHNIRAGESPAFYTDMLVSAMEKNPFVDIITHPNEPAYPVDYSVLAKTAKRLGMAVEINNSKLLYQRTTEAETAELIQACRKIGCLVAVNSDTHAFHELGNDDAVRPLLERLKFPEKLIVNQTAENARAFIEGRRKLKR